MSDTRSRNQLAGRKLGQLDAAICPQAQCEVESMGGNEWVISRRQLVAMLGASAGAAALPAWAEMGDEIAPQPYFAGVNRVLEALAKLGSPVATQDAQQLAALARQN